MKIFVSGEKNYDGEKKIEGLDFRFPREKKGVESQPSQREQRKSQSIDERIFFPLPRRDDEFSLLQKSFEEVAVENRFQLSDLTIDVKKKNAFIKKTHQYV